MNVIKVPFELGFEVRYSPAPLWSGNLDVFLGLELLAEVNAGAFDEYDSLVTTFFMLAGSGALSGAGIPPELSAIGDREALPSSGNLLRFQLHRCRIDEMSTVLCANTLSLGHDRFPLRQVWISSARTLGGTVRQMAFDPQVSDPYPQLYASLPFRMDFNPDQDAPRLLVEFLDGLNRTEESIIRDHLLAWAAACSGGVYGAVLAPPAHCYLSFDPKDLVVNYNHLTLSIAKLRCHEAVLRGLVNACVALHATVAPVASVSLC